MRGGITQFFQERWFHRRALRVYGHAKIIACANGVGDKNAAASPLASALEYQNQQRELSGAAWRGSALYSGRTAADSRIDRPLHGQRKDSARSRGPSRHDGFRRRKRALHLGENARWHDKLANVRSLAARLKRGYHARRGLWCPRRRIFPRFRFQQSRERPRSSAPFGETVAAALWAARQVVVKHISDVLPVGKRLQMLVLRVEARNVPL